MSLWTQLKGQNYFSNYKVTAWRIVEDQSKSTTRKFVDTSAEHDLLESLLEKNKPNIKYYGDEHYFKDLHYLLFTPFRYPPLKWGSRFGSHIERGIFYCSLALETAMSEKAFYKLAFFKASEGQLGGKTVSYTAFRINIASERFISLCHPPFDAYHAQISSKENYETSQALGREMRLAQVECFQYKSARCSQKGSNVGIFTPKALVDNRQVIRTFLYLNCYATKEVVEFSFKHRDNLGKSIFLRNTYDEL